MRIVTKEVKIFKLEELGRAEQEKAIFLIRENLVNAMYENLEEALLEKLNTVYGLDPDAVYYSLGYCQGGGVCFVIKNILNWTNLKAEGNKNAFELAVENLEKNEKENVLEYVNADYNIGIEKSWWNYQHSHTCNFVWEKYKNDDIGKEVAVNSTVEKLCSEGGAFYELYHRICSELEDYGYKLLDYPYEEVENYIQEADVEFLENGSIFRD